jgi:prepilin-type N-terminal cleavage/methylation domain-containing protein
MRRRSGFTLVEVLVAMALILFIMTILGAAFSAATQTVSDLKSAGDLAEKLRGAATVIKRDLEANQLTQAGGTPVRLKDLWSGATPQPPQTGFLRLFEGNPAVLEGTDINGQPSYYQTSASLAYTITLTQPCGARRNDYLSAYVPGTPLVYAGDPGQTPPDQRYEDTPNTATPSVYNYASAEAALFLVPTGDVTDASGTGGAQKLYALYRRQFLTVPNGWGPSNTSPYPVGPASQYVEVSILPSAGEVPTASPTFNSLTELTMPIKRFWMNRGNPAGVYQAAPPPPAIPNRFGYATMGDCNPAYKASDLLMPDVLSMDVRVLLAGDSDFRDLFDQQVQQYATGPSGGNNPAFTGAGTPRVFDTWSGAGPYALWNTPGLLTSVPLFMRADGVTISIRAIQVTLRVWDFKTKKTRQVTIVQEM